MSAPAPSRSTGKFVLSIGLVNIGLDIFSGQEESRVSRATYIKHLNKVADANGVETEIEELHPVGQKQYDKINGADVQRSDTIKCVSSTDGTLVEIDDEELQQFVTAANGECEFVGFVKRAAFQEAYETEKLYQVRPGTVKVGTKKTSPFEKPFALFMEVMRIKHYVGLIKLTQRGVTRVYGLYPDGRLYSLLFDEEVREARPMPTATLSAPEKDMAGKLFDAFVLADAPVFEDTSSNAVLSYVEEKAKALANGEAIKMPEVITEDGGGESMDLMALLQASVGK